MFGSCRGKEQKLGDRIFWPILQDEAAHILANRCATRLAGDDDGDVVSCEALGLAPSLGRLADPFPAFECDELTAFHWLASISGGLF